MRTAITPKLTTGSYPALPLAADAADLTFTAADVVNGNSAKFGGRMLVVIARNDDAAAQTVTVTSVAAGLNRKGDIETYSIGAGEYAVLGPFQREGWASAGVLQLDASSANVNFAVLQLNL